MAGSDKGHVLRRLVVSGFSLVSLVGVLTLWVSAPLAGTAGSPAVAPQAVATASPPPTRAAAGEWPRPSAEPLDLTPERIRLLEQSGEQLRRVREREEKLELRERLLDAARAELERKVAVFERETSSARDKMRETLERDLSDRRRQAEEREKELDTRETALTQLQGEMKKQVGQQFDQVVNSYLGMKPKRAARVLEERGPTEAAVLLFLMPEDARTRILGEMEPTTVAAILKTPFADRLMPPRSAGSAKQ